MVSRAFNLSPEDGITWYEFDLLYDDMGRPEVALEAFQESSVNIPIHGNWQTAMIGWVLFYLK